MDEKIIIGISDQNTKCRNQGYRNWIQWVTLKLGHQRRIEWEDPKDIVPAAVSEGRWYIKCPGATCDIGYAMDEYQPYAFCFECLNIDNDFKPYNVLWQNVKDLKLLLGARIDFRQRNYLPHLGETHDHLRKENENLINGRFYGVLNS